MTTFQEISNCEKANFEYWTVQAKFKLALYKENKSKIKTRNYQNTYISAAKGYRKAFLVTMQNRRDKKYYNS